MKTMFKKAIEKKTGLKIESIEFKGFEKNLPVYIVLFENGSVEKWFACRKWIADSDRVVTEVWKG